MTLEQLYDQHIKVLSKSEQLRLISLISQRLAKKRKSAKRKQQGKITMAYSDFNLKQLQTEFQLDLVKETHIFAHLPPQPISPHLAESLAENVTLAISINTEKARSELIIANVLVELRRILHKQVSFFSGIEFNVDKELGLTGYCDFMISLSEEQLFLKAPVIALVEAKNENLMAGLAQCMAEMVAARLFNQKEALTVNKIYGVITSGTAWKFLKYEAPTMSLDLHDYSIDNPEQILGILTAMTKQAA